MALRAAALAHEHALARQFLLAGQGGIEPSERVELRRDHAVKFAARHGSRGGSVPPQATSVKRPSANSRL